MADEDFNLFKELTKLPRPHIVVDFPLNKDIPLNMECPIALVTLNNAELQEVHASAQRTVNKLLRDEMPKKGEYSPGYETLYSDNVAMELLFKSCKNAADIRRPFFPSKASLHELTADQLGVLVNHYNTLVATRGPIISNMTSREMDDLIERIQNDAKQGAFFLSSLTLEELKAFATYTASLVALPSSSPTDNSSPGSPLEENI